MMKKKPFLGPFFFCTFLPFVPFYLFVPFSVLPIFIVDENLGKNVFIELRRSQDQKIAPSDCGGKTQPITDQVRYLVQKLIKISDKTFQPQAITHK
jgi:hypothetical protein